MQVYISLGVAVVGLFLYMICTTGENKPKLARVGEILLLAGVLALLLLIGGHSVSMLRE